MVVSSSCIPPVNTVPRGGQIIMHSNSQYGTTWWSDHRVFHQSTQCHVVVRLPCIPPVNTVPHGGQIIVYSTCQQKKTTGVNEGKKTTGGDEGKKTKGGDEEEGGNSDRPRSELTDIAITGFYWF